MSDCTAIVRGIPHIPSVTEVNVRNGPGTNFEVIFTVPVGMDSLRILDVATDAEGKAKDGKVYQWFKLTFHGGAVGFIRDDLIDLMGECTSQGYQTYSERTFAFTQTRTGANEPRPAEPPADLRQPDKPFDPFSLDRIRKAAFAITDVFEGKGFPSYQNADSGIVSYGRFQFTLGAGSLGTVCRRYCERSLTTTADEIRAAFLPRVLARDPGLRNDLRLRDLLIAAAEEDVMKTVQNEVATEGFWERMLNITARPRNIQLPLSLAMLFDIAINFGVMDGLVTRAEDDLGVPQRSRVRENGISEQQLMVQVADIRKRSHDRQAERDNLPGLKVRGDFWMTMAVNGDWNLAGDANGNILVKGQPVQVRSPQDT
jgi:hypothetical protein